MVMHPTEQVLNDYVDDALPEVERADVEGHLAACDACRALVDDLRAIAQAAASLEPLDPPPGVWPRIASGIHQSAAAAPRARAYWTRWLAAAAVVALATIVRMRNGPPLRRGGGGH